MIILETERLLFRDHVPEDLDAFADMEADPEVRRFVGGQPRSRADAERKFRNTFLRPASDRMRLWATIFKPEGRYIGYCGIYPHRDESGLHVGEGVLAFYLARPYWRRGLASEAGEAFIRFGFRELGLSRVVASVEVGNDASVAVIRKLGFRRIGTSSAGARTFDDFELRSGA
ncbi:MAG TPA: GNAT family N-acetyltransferase [Thermoanaerobaculia bacterium]|nr:GNAT family N-acetyltransferase [Thermoanaerobaculia bacterium]